MNRRLHEVEGAVRGNEGDGAVVLEPCQPHTLVELDVLHLHALVLAAASLRLEQHLRACAPMCQPTPGLPGTRTPFSAESVQYNSSAEAPPAQAGPGRPIMTLLSCSSRSFRQTRQAPDQCRVLKNSFCSVADSPAAMHASGCAHA